MVITVLVMVYTQCKPLLPPVGTLKIQGTLQKDPSNTDWVDIDNIVIGDGSTALTNSYFNNFTGNFVWIRVEVTEFTAGTINSVYMAH